MEEMNGRVNPAAALSDSDDEPQGKFGGKSSGGKTGNSGKNRPMASQPDSEDENDRRTPVKNVKQYQTKL